MAISAAAIGAAVADAAASVGTALAAVGITTGTLVGAVASLAFSYIGNALLGAKAPSNTGTSALVNRTQQIRQPAGTHQIILGSVKVSGTLAYIYSPGIAKTGFASAVNGNAPADYKPNQLLYTIVVLSGPPAAAVQHAVLPDA